MQLEIKYKMANDSDLSVNIPEAPAQTVAKSSIQNYLDKATDVLDKFGIIQKRDDRSKLADLLKDALVIDKPKTMAVMRVLQYADTFDELVRDKIEEQRFGDRYKDIADAFTTIREDTGRLVEQADGGKNGLGQKVGYYWMKIRRGTPNERFEKIRKIFDQVAKDTNDQIQREDDIINAYIDFRMAFKGAENLCQELLQKQVLRLEGAKKAFGEAAKAVEDFKGEDAVKKGELQFARDQAKRDYDVENSRHNLIQRVTMHMSTGYDVGELLAGRLSQTHEVKKDLYTQAVTFFDTNKQNLTFMSAVYASLFGVSETTKTIGALKDGANAGLEQIAKVGGKVLTQGVEMAHGNMYDLDKVKMLADAELEFQKTTYQLVERLDREAVESAKQVRVIVDKTKAEYAKTINEHAIAALPAAVPAN
jgi:hypothetical protein